MKTRIPCFIVLSEEREYLDYSKHAPSLKSKPCRTSGQVFQRVVGRHQAAVLGAEPVGPVIAVVHFPGF